MYGIEYEDDTVAFYVLESYEIVPQEDRAA